MSAFKNGNNDNGSYQSILRQQEPEAPAALFRHFFQFLPNLHHRPGVKLAIAKQGFSGGFGFFGFVHLQPEVLGALVESGVAGFREFGHSCFDFMYKYRNLEWNFKKKEKKTKPARLCLYNKSNTSSNFVFLSSINVPKSAKSIGDAVSIK